MWESAIQNWSCSEAPAWNEKELLRYARVGQSDEESSGFRELLSACQAEAASVCEYKVCYRRFLLAGEAQEEDGLLDLGFAKVKSQALAKYLAGCHSILLFGATLGIGLDRLLARAGRLSPAKAWCYQAIGTERIEELCDCFVKDMENQARACQWTLRPRFSPGYGDLKLDLQKDIFQVLDCPRRIGLTLTDTLLMSPTKSVTALIGITDCSGEL